MKCRSIKTLFLLPAILCCVSNASAQTGIFYDEFGAGFKATSMGQAFTAVADNSSAAYYNPAGLSQVTGILEATFGYIYTMPNLWARYPGNTGLDFSGQTSSRGLYIGIASSMDLEKIVREFPWFKRLSFGMILWNNLPEQNQYYAGPNAIRPHFLRHDHAFQSMAIAISMAVEITPWLSAGAGIIPSNETTAENNASAAVNHLGLIPGLEADKTTGLRLSVHQTAKIYVVPVLGLLFKPPFAGLEEKLSLGVSFRDENVSHHGRGIIAKGFHWEDENGTPIPLYFEFPLQFNHNLVSYIPLQITAAIAARPVKGLTLAYDMTFKKYSNYLTYLDVIPYPPFKDTYTHRFGAEYAFDPGFSYKYAKKICKISLRGGYYFEPTPTTPYVPSMGLPNNNIYDSDQNVFSAGIGVTIAGRKESAHDFQVYGQYHLFSKYSRLTYIDPVYALMQSQGGTGGGFVNAGNLATDLGGDVWSFGLSYTFRL